MFYITPVFYQDIECLDLQFKLLNRFFHIPFAYWIIDNSKNEEERQKLENWVWARLDVHVIPIEGNTETNPSRNHAFALNQGVKWLIDFVGVDDKDCIFTIDQDVFPISPIYQDYYEPWLGKYGLFGHQRETYPWVGTQVRSIKLIKKYGFNAMPYNNGTDEKPDWYDTNATDFFTTPWKDVQEKANLKDLFKVTKVVELPNGTYRNVDKHYTILDNYWLHFMNIGNRNNSRFYNTKRKYVFDKLKELL